MDLTIQQAEPVDTPIKSVTLVLTEREAQVLKHVGNYSRRVADAITSSLTGTTDGHPLPATEIDRTLAAMWRALGNAGVQVK